MISLPVLFTQIAGAPPLLYYFLQLNIMPKPEIYGNQVVEAAKALYEQLSHWASVPLNYSILLQAVHTVTGANDLSDRIKSIIHQNGSISIEAFAQFAEVSLFQALTPGTGDPMSVYTQRYIWAKTLWACARYVVFSKKSFRK